MSNDTRRIEAGEAAHIQRPEWSCDVRVGDMLRVKDEMMTRGGQVGEVTGWTMFGLKNVPHGELIGDDEGVALDFAPDFEFGVSILFFEWSELEPEVLRPA